MQAALGCPHCKFATAQRPWTLLGRESTVCANCGDRYKAVFNERSTLMAIATGIAGGVAAFLLANGVGYPGAAEVVACIAGVLCVVAFGYRYALCLHPVE